MADQKVLVIDDSTSILKVVSTIAKRVGFIPITAKSLRELETVLCEHTDFFCACVDYSLPDAPNGEAIDFVISQQIPAFVLTGNLNEGTRENILSKPIIDYIPKETIQSFDYVSRLLHRLKNNHQTKLLIVDDARSSRIFMQSLLVRHNFTVLEAENGQEALKVLSQKPDIKVVVTDNEMPVMNGIELVSAIRQQFSSDQIAIIGISGTRKQSLSARFLKTGANDYLTKPFTHEEFFTRIFRNLEFIENVATARHAANHDFLTNLTNRRHFFEVVPQLITDTRVNQHPCIVALMDLDKFKSVNDTYGHDVGDEVLIHMANRLMSHFREDNIITARFGGEEFCVFFANVTQAEAAGRLEFFRHHLESFPMELQSGDTLEVTTSIGVAQLKSNQTIEQAITQADKGLFQAKDEGRNLMIEVP
ncbi:diguanylate cyclase [Algibacillus agarilyticus]|uniref:diguanylate cyclase n=1 Tax=Algibacillus agarilyticus TaxID=2234133 RepID=UPI000DD02C2A|nr:diguanylate cyclase [Algibacillus agarilyticus]